MSELPSRGFLVGNSAHSDINYYTPIWHLPEPDTEQLLYSTDYAVIKPQRNKGDGNSDQVRRTLAKILPLKLLLSGEEYIFYKFDIPWARGTCGYRIARNRMLTDCVVEWGDGGPPRRSLDKLDRKSVV